MFVGLVQAGPPATFVGLVQAGPMREGVQLVHQSGWESQEGPCESLKGSIALVIDVLF